MNIGDDSTDLLDPMTSAIIVDLTHSSATHLIPLGIIRYERRSIGIKIYGSKSCIRIRYIQEGSTKLRLLIVLDMKDREGNVVEWT